MKADQLLEIIKKRRSVRKFKNQEVSREIIDKSLEAARWAPSGLNNQPWKFTVLSGQAKDSLATYTKYSLVIKEANKLILVFLNKERLYNYQKDLMAVGAAIQNIILYLWSAGVGTCWLGEILNKAEDVQKKLKTDPQLELAAVIAVGLSTGTNPSRSRLPLEQLIL